MHAAGPRSPWLASVVAEQDGAFINWIGAEASYIDKTLTYASTSKLAMQWASLFLQPYCKIGAPRGRPTYWQIQGPLKAFPDMEHALLEGEALELHRGATGRLLALSPSRIVAVTNDRENAFFLDRESGEVLQLIGGSSPEHLRELSRHVRSLLAEFVYGERMLPFHASAAALGGGAILLPGGSGAGKTTSMLHLVVARGCQYIANDRTLVELAGPGVRLHSYPLSLRLGAGSLSDFPVLRTHLHAWNYFDAVLTPLEEQVGAMSKLELNIDEFCEITGCQFASDAICRTIIFPELDFDADVVRPVSPAEAVDLLLAQLEIPEPTRDSWIAEILVGKRIDLDSKVRFACAVARQVPCYQARGSGRFIAKAALEVSALR